ncbi:MAG: phytanoyl-CoA dioxygenase family protein [Rhizobiaceae bacterium]|nr:phytanoyl-CoA dioxygenase family protein [Rhizobiaceae bacterium]
MSNASDLEARYQRDGFVFPLDVLDNETASDVRADLESAEAELEQDPERLSLLRGYPDRLLPSFDKLIRHPTMIDAASRILGPDLMVWSAALFIKEANSPSIVSWHQDLTYWGLDDAEETTCWLALSQVNHSSGAMKFVPGSHRQNIVDHVDTFADDNLLSRGQEIAVDVDEKDAVLVELKPGQASLHHGHLFHASGPNSSSDRRIGCAIRYIKASMRQQDETKTLVAHVSGEDRWQNFRVAGSPRGRLNELDFDMCRQDVAARNSILYEGVGQ